MTRRTPAAAIRSAIRSQLKHVHVALPGRIESYDANARRVAVKPLVRRTYRDEFGERKSEGLPIINDVPVVLPGSGGARILFPINKGDSALLVFSESSLERWLRLDREVDPQDARKHALSDAIAIPGLQATATTNDPSMHFTESEILLGDDGADDPVALRSDLQDLYDALQQAPTAGMDGGAALKTAILSFLDGVLFPRAATKVKAK